MTTEEVRLELTSRSPFRREWAKWRLTIDRITSRPDYRYGHRNAGLLCALAHFAQQQMGAANTRYWRQANR